MRNLFFILTLFIAPFSACTNQSADTSDSQQAEAQEAISPDSLRRAYLSYRSQQSDPLPLRQIVEAGKLYPVDEAPRDTAFFVFRERLLDAVNRRDIFPVMEAVDEQVKVGFSSENGLPAFITAWNLTSEEKIPGSGLWEVLEKVLRGGGVFQERDSRFVAPYVFATWPDAFDAVTHAAVAGAGVRLREAPNLTSRILTVVSNDVVLFLGKTEATETIGGETFPWVHVKTLSGTEGYVWGRFVEQPTGYRAVFEKRNGRWKMVSLLAGD